MAAPDTSNACAGPFGAAYDWWIERERVARVVGSLLWGIDTRPMFASMCAELGAVAPDATIIDVPCGGGVAFRTLDPGRHPARYLAVDLDEPMLARARRRAAARGLTQIDFLASDMRHLPMADGAADLCLSYSGLHMVPDPDAAIAELARVLCPGGRLAGSTFLGEGTRRQRVLFALSGRAGHVTPRGTAADLERWLAEAGVIDVEVRARRGFALFSGRKR